MKRKILIAEDNDINRDMLKNILIGEYEVLEAVDGEDTLSIMKQNADSLSAVLLDIVMPKMTGYEVLEKWKEDETLSHIPVIVVTGIDDKESEEKALALGAIDYVTKPYASKLIKHRLLNTIKLREDAAAINAIRIDALTGLYNRNEFLSQVSLMVDKKEPSYYVMSCFDIEKFKVINDQKGSRYGDMVLKKMGKVLQEAAVQLHGISSHINADNFAALYPASYLETDELKQIIDKLCDLDNDTTPLTLKVGRCIIDDLTLTASAIYDRATMAKATIKGIYDRNVAIYDESFRNTILGEQEIVSQMKIALNSNQFEVWFQPQYNHDSGALLGAEALVRWRHPEKGLISPGVFIPIFEKNEFIYELDKYVWEKCCIFIQKFMKKGVNPMPVSVNISRCDIYHDDIVDHIYGLINKYCIPVDMLRLEITESAFSKSANQIIEVVKKLKQQGFTIEIDDFGSGYSSLNTLKDVPADVLKLDMKFLEGEKNTDRGGSIVESIVRMAKWINMSVIAEGVEKIEQADFLRSIGCYYIQGYLYSKPIPQDEYEKILISSVKEETMLALEKVQTYDNEAFWNPESMDTIIFNSFVGGASIFEYEKGKVEIIRVNKRYAKVFFGESDKENAIRDILTDYMDEETRLQTINIIDKAMKSLVEEIDEFHLYNIRGDGRTIYIRSTMRVIARAGERYLFYCTHEDITEEKEAEQKIKEYAKKLEFLNESVTKLMNDTPGGFARMKICSGERVAAEYVNKGFCEMLGREEEEIMSFYRSDATWMVHPDDVPIVKRAVKQMIEQNHTQSFQYRIKNKYGEYIPYNVIGKVVKDQDDNIFIHAYYSEVTEEEKEEQQQKELMENLPCGAGIYEYTGGEILGIYLNRRLWMLTGRDDYNINKRPVMEYVLPEDREYLIKVVRKAIINQEMIDCVIRVLHANGNYIPFRLNGNVVLKPEKKAYIYIAYSKLDEKNATFSEMIPVALQTMLVYSSDWISVKDTNLNYVCASHTLARMAGLEDEREIVGKNDYDLFSKEMADKYREDDEKILKTQNPLIDYVEIIPSADGSMRYSCTSKYVLKDSKGTVVGVYGIGRDITENRDAFSKLKLLTDTIPGGIATFDVLQDKVHTLYANEQIYELTGYQKGDVNSNTYDALKFVAREDLPELKKQLNGLLEDGSMIDVTLRILTKKEGYRWINVKATEAEKTKGRTRVNAVVFDVTGMKMHEMNIMKEKEHWKSIAEEK